MYTQAQVDAFVAQLYPVKVFGTEERAGMLYADTEGGCAYTDGTHTLTMSGEQDGGGELHWDNGGWMECDYDAQTEEVTLHWANSAAVVYSDWDAAAAAVFATLR